MRCAAALLLVVCLGLSAFLPSQGAGLSGKAKKVNNVLGKIFSQATLAKLVRMLADQGPNSRAFVIALNNVTLPALQCFGAAGEKVRGPLSARTMTEQQALQQIQTDCQQYDAELSPVLTALEGMGPELKSFDTSMNGDVPQSVKTVLQQAATLGDELKQDPSLVNNTAVFGPKMKALTDGVRNLPQADVDALVKEYPGLKAIMSPQGSEYKSFNDLLDLLDAKASGQDYDPTALKKEGDAMLAYFRKNLLSYVQAVNKRIKAYTVSAATAADQQVNAVARKLSVPAAQYFTLGSKSSQFIDFLNTITDPKKNLSSMQ